MAKIRFVVVGFSSHQNWAEGYQRASKAHNVELEIIPGDRWKFRMQAAAAELEHVVAEDDDVLVVDGMLDVTPLVALLRTRQRCPRILVYMHENQLTTPFTGQDRDKKNETHWHYGMCHWRSLLVADAFVFNSRQHLDVFSKALPRLINEQCPRDTVEWHLRKATHLLQTKCTVLAYGLELDQIFEASGPADDDGPPAILWNARLEEDKDPATFCEVLSEIKQTGIPFQLIVLGTDPSKGAQWYARFQKEFSDEILFLGWCTDRDEYSKWLKKASVVISTARHETFGISIVESVFCGALPLLPRRLSYPELFSPEDYPGHFYTSTSQCVAKLKELLRIAANPVELLETSSRTKAAIKRFRWSFMGSVYDIFFSAIAAGEDIRAVGLATQVEANASFDNETSDDEQTQPSTKAGAFTTTFITEADDPSVALYRPKSLRDHKEYHHQLRAFHLKGSEPPSLHGGRRATSRMLEAIAMGSPIQPLSFLTTEELAQKVLAPKYQDHPLSAPVYVAKKELLDTIRGQKLNSGDSILTMLQFPVVSSLHELIAQPPILVLDDVRNAENVGSILRTAFCLGITSVVASSTAWAALRDTRSARCSMGTIYYHLFYRACNLSDTLAEIRQGGIRVYGVEIGDGAKPVGPHGTDRKWAAVMGNEDQGLTIEVRQACDNIVYVPQAHGDSLNVGHAAAITLFELGREAPVPEHDGRAACK